ncbi:MAG: CoA transferase [Pseudomonadota bacterium]
MSSWEAGRGASERVGVVVIHGVGETTAGWTGALLLPRLEYWVAHRKLGEPPRFTDRTLRLLVRATDQHVAVLVRDTQAFLTLCQAIRQPSLQQDPRFQTERQRERNCDDLIEAVERAFAGANASDIVSTLLNAGLPATATYDPVARVHGVRDPSSSDPKRRWLSFSHNWAVGERDVMFAELFWADLSKVGYTIPTRLAALVQLFLESPFVLGQAFLRGSSGADFTAIRYLILTANWLMRWPIAGLNVAMFTPALLAILYFQFAGAMGFEAATWFPTFIATVLIGVAVVGYRGSVRLEHRQIGLSDLSFSGALSALALLAMLGLAVAIAPYDNLISPEWYLLPGVALLLAIWFVWSLVTVIAVLLISSLALVRLIRRPKPHAPRLARSSAALSLSLILGIVWKFVLALLGWFVITLLVPQSETGVGCPAFTTASQFLRDDVSPRCLLTNINGLLLAVAAMNAIALALVALAVSGVYGVRILLKKVRRRAAREGRLRLPRVIASPVLIATLFIGAIINFVLFYGVIYEDLEIAQRARDQLARNASEAAVPAATLGLLVFTYMIYRIVEFSNDFVHIGRDLIDHQYDPNPHASRHRGPALAAVDTVLPGQTEVVQRAKPVRFRRRQRIQRRLESLFDDVIAHQGVDRLIIVAHSQGSVIAHDYLVNQDDLSAWDDNTKRLFKRVTALDLVTVGSPLKHLYRYYFDDYDRSEMAAPETERLISRLRSWTNLWRVDDPIGRDVDLHPVIQNIGLPPGGHLDYWREEAVCSVLWGRITNVPTEK